MQRDVGFGREELELPVTPFHPAEAAPHRLWLFFGKRLGGKTHAMIQLMHGMQARAEIDSVHVVTRTEGMHEYRGLVPPENIHTYAHFQQVLNTLFAPGEQRKLLVLDDFPFPVLCHKSEYAILPTLTRAHEFNTTVFLSMQYPLGSLKQLLENGISYVFTRDIPSALHLERFAPHYFPMFSDRHQFRLALREYGKSHRFLVANLEHNTVHHYRANPPPAPQMHRFDE